MKTKLKGFTLVELVITIAIVIILSVVSVPIYRGYVEKAQLSEGYALLGALISAQKAYYSEYGNFYNSDYDGYTRWTSVNPVLGIDVRGNKYFTWFNTGWNPANLKVEFVHLLHKPVELQSDDPNKKVLEVIYNITTGTTIQENKYH